MDEVDIDSAEDLNELEARLYAQIHHEASETFGTTQAPTEEQTLDVVTDNGTAHCVSTSEAAIRALSKRYWTSGQFGAHNVIQQQQNTKYRVRNQNKASAVDQQSKNNKEIDNPQRKDENGKKMAAGEKTSFMPAMNSSNLPAVEQPHTDEQKNNVCSNTPAKAIAAGPVSIAQSLENITKTPAHGLKRIKNPFVRKAHTKELIKSNVNPKQGPFFKQQQKLEKIKRIENKKQKSKRVSAKKQTTIDFVDLVSSEESDSSDVIMIPIPPPPTYSLDDSDDADSTRSKINGNSILVQEENALDSTDVQMTTSSSFIKPQQISIQSLATASGCEDKRVENSSRCTSPCSIQSSDDFIGQTDRSRLLEPGSGMADDEDLLLLTSDVNSLLETPQFGQRGKEETNKSLDTSAESIDLDDSQKFATPKTLSASRKSDYSVDGQFRAIDVYESESDITDSVYSKGTPKTTVIRQIDTSSEEVEDITCSNSRTKRLRKRRRSSGNKSSDPNNENNNSSSEDSNEDDNEGESNSGADRTGIPFISRGPAVERKMRKSGRTHSTCSPHTTQGRSSKSDHMSDGDFIAKLNDLVQGQDGDEIDDSDEIEDAPSAREIAEKILGGTTVNRQKERAVPNKVCNQLTDVFETIDHMEDADKVDNVNSQESSVDNSNTINVGQRQNVVYRSLPEEDNAQILTFVDDPSPSGSSLTYMKKHASNGSPIYNVVYSRGRKMGGGLGWNDEMRKFYQESWNGEGFLLSEIWKKMNPDRNLWKIYNEDRYNKPNKRQNNLKCTNCCEFGHARYQCKRPRKPCICYMCGESGHQEPRCPNTICLRCGNKTQVFVKGCNACSFQNRLICPICKIRGHSIDHCPDKWRRYHSTTEPNAFPNNIVAYNPRKYCSICGNRGHLSDVCRSAMHFMEYPVIATAVKSHQKSYNDIAVKTPFGGIGFNLMYEPCLKYGFDMSQRTTTEKYYGRFLNSVGMGFLMKRKRVISPPPIDDVSAKKSRKLSKRNDRKANEGNAPNQVPEITESGSVDNESPMEAASGSTTQVLVESTVPDGNIQLNVVKATTPTHSNTPNFKPPNKVTSSNNPPQIMDSDSNYSFSEHFDDVPSTSNVSNKTDSYEMQKENTKQSSISRLLASKEKPKSREMETLPEFIPLVDSTGGCDDENTESRGGDHLRVGISRKFVVAESDDENQESGKLSPVVASLPCEAKIYLTHLHSKYLLSPDGRNFLTKSAKSYQLKARLDFTSVGHVLVVFGLPDNQDKFQRELLLKYRELSDHMINTNQLQPTPNVPKRTDVLVRFLRDDINQLLSNLGNVNHLFSRLQYVERQQSKSGFKLADKIRRSLNMILVGQAGLQDGNMHLDKLMAGLKTLINDYSAEDVTPSSLRSEITAHWKVIFSSYRHSNYRDLVENYNSLISKNRMPKLIIDPLLLGHKVLDTSLTAEQRENLEQPKLPLDAPPNSEQRKPALNNTPKHSKQNKRKQTLGGTSSPNTPVPTSKAKMSISHMSPAKTPSTQSIRTDNTNVNTPIKSKLTANNSSVTPVNASKKQQHKMMPPPPFANPEKRSTVTTGVTELSDKWKTTCDTILTEITAKPSERKGNNPVRDSKLPSTFWSRESMRYLNECVSIVESRPELMEKIKRVQNKSINGQLSYNDYLAVIKLHTALAGK